MKNVDFRPENSLFTLLKNFPQESNPYFHAEKSEKSTKPILRKRYYRRVDGRTGRAEFTEPSGRARDPKTLSTILKKSNQFSMPFLMICIKFCPLSHSLNFRKQSL